MRLLPAVLFASFAPCLVFSQTYTIKTFAGGGLPPNLVGTSASLGRMDGVAVDQNGNIFMTLRDYSIVVRVDSVTGNLTLVAGIGSPGFGYIATYYGGTGWLNGGTGSAFSGDNGPATSAQLANASGVAVDSIGNLYIADTNNARIRKVSGGVITTFAGGGSSLGDNGPPTSAQLNSPIGVAVDSRGSVYIAEGNRIRKVSNGVITTVAGNGTAGYSGDGGPATSAQLNRPSGIAVDSAGNLYIADTNNNSIRKVSGGVITTVAGNGTAGFSGDNGPATGAQLSGPYGIVSDPAGNLYTADGWNNRIRKISGGVITTVAGGGAVQFSAPPNTSCAAFPAGFVPFTSVFSLSNPDSFGDQFLVGNTLQANASDPLANYKAIENLPLPAVPNQTFCGSVTLATGYSVEAYVPTAEERSGDYSSDSGPSELLLDPASGNLPFPGGYIPANRLGGIYAWRISASTGDNGPATSAQLNQPHGIAIDSTGNLYVADYGNDRIRQVSNGVITTVAGNGACCFTGGDGGLATSVFLNSPLGVTVDPAGSLYISDSGANLIREVSNGVISTLAGGGHWLGDNGPATGAPLSSPSGTAVDSVGNLYIADARNNRIRKVANGVITTVAGGGSSLGDGGPATSAQLYPAGFAFDSGGNLYIADYGNNRIRKVSNGMITTVAGNGTSGFSGDNGPATSAQLNGPSSIAVDSAGNFYIADSNNFRIRKVSNGVITTVTAVPQSGGPVSYLAYGVAVDSAGNLYTAGYGGVARVSNGVITTIAGNGTPGFSGDNGPATSAQLGFYVGGVAVDSSGNVYVADAANRRVRLLIPSDPPCSAASVSPTTFSPGASGGNLGITIKISGSCAWAVQSLPSWITYSGNVIGTGPATITLVVAANGGAARSATVSIAGASVAVTQASGQTAYTCANTTPPVITSVDSASGYGGYSYFASGSWLEIKGTNLADPADPRLAAATNPGQWTLSDFIGVNAPTMLDGVSVSIDGKPAYVWYLSPTQLNVQAPEDSAIGNAAITVTNCKATSSPFTLTHLALAPGFLAPANFNASGTQYMVATFVSDGAYVLNASIGAALGVNSRPAKPGDLIIAYGIGFGDVTPSILPGVIVQQSNTLVNPVAISLGSANATLAYAGLAGNFVGLYEFYMTVPSGLANGDYQIYVTQNGTKVPQTMYLTVHN